MVSMEKVDAWLLRLGLKDVNAGTVYLRDMVAMYRPRMGLTKELYPAIAQRYRSSPQRIERCCRYAIEYAWTYGSQAAQEQLFGASISTETGRPTVGHFVSRLYRECEEDALDNGLSVTA